jgi:hypothetical protein
MVSSEDFAAAGLRYERSRREHNAPRLLGRWRYGWFASMLVGAALCWLPLGASSSAGVYQTVDAFLGEIYPDTAPEHEFVAVRAELRRALEAVLGRRFSRLRVEYWTDGRTTTWILEQIGKTEPITIGVSINGGAVAAVRILEFRESRGWEVRFPFFTEQFSGAQLAGDRRLDRNIDGITGATLSVAAVDKTVRAALLLDRWVRVGLLEEQPELASN